MIPSISWTHCHIFLFTNNSRLFPDTGWEGWTWRWWARWGRPGVWVWRPRPRRATCRPPPPPWSRSQPRVSRRSIAAGNLGWTRRRWHLFSLSLSLTYTHSLPALHLGSATYPGPSVRQTKTISLCFNKYFFRAFMFLSYLWYERKRVIHVRFIKLLFGQNELSTKRKTWLWTQNVGRQNIQFILFVSKTRL